MASIYQSADVVPGRPALTTTSLGDVTAVKAFLPLTAALVINDLLEMMKLPAAHVPIDFLVETDDLDSNGSPTITLDCGIMSGTPGVADVARTVGTEFLSASTIAQAGGLVRYVAATAAAAKIGRIIPVEFDRSLGFLVKAAPATGVGGLTNMNVNRGAWQPSTVYTANDYIILPDGRRVKCTTGGTSAAATTGQLFPPAIAQAVAGGTQTDGTVTWTMSDPYVALTVMYRPGRYGV